MAPFPSSARPVIVCQTYSALASSDPQLESEYRRLRPDDAKLYRQVLPCSAAANIIRRFHEKKTVEPVNVEHSDLDIGLVVERNLEPGNFDYVDHDTNEKVRCDHAIRSTLLITNHQFIEALIDKAEIRLRTIDRYKPYTSSDGFISTDIPRREDHSKDPDEPAEVPMDVTCENEFLSVISGTSLSQAKTDLEDVSAEAVCKAGRRPGTVMLTASFYPEVPSQYAEKYIKYSNLSPSQYALILACSGNYRSKHTDKIKRDLEIHGLSTQRLHYSLNNEKGNEIERGNQHKSQSDKDTANKKIDMEGVDSGMAGKVAIPDSGDLFHINTVAVKRYLKAVAEGLCNSDTSEQNFSGQQNRNTTSVPSFHHKAASSIDRDQSTSMTDPVSLCCPYQHQDLQFYHQHQSPKLHHQHHHASTAPYTPSPAPPTPSPLTPEGMRAIIQSELKKSAVDSSSTSANGETGATQQATFHHSSTSPSPAVVTTPIVDADVLAKMVSAYRSKQERKVESGSRSIRKRPRSASRERNRQRKGVPTASNKKRCRKQRREPSNESDCESSQSDSDHSSDSPDFDSDSSSDSGSPSRPRGKRKGETSGKGSRKGEGKHRSTKPGARDVKNDKEAKESKYKFSKEEYKKLKQLLDSGVEDQGLTSTKTTESKEEVETLSDKPANTDGTGKNLASSSLDSKIELLLAKLDKTSTIQTTPTAAQIKNDKNTPAFSSDGTGDDTSKGAEKADIAHNSMVTAETHSDLDMGKKTQQSNMTVNKNAEKEGDEEAPVVEKLTPSDTKKNAPIFIRKGQAPDAPTKRNTRSIVAAIASTPQVHNSLQSERPDFDSIRKKAFRSLLTF